MPFLQEALHKTYNSASDQKVRPKVLEDIPIQKETEWPPFLYKKMSNALMALLIPVCSRA
jgi:hypothetical protein